MAGRSRRPPIVIGGCRIEQYAIRPRSIRFTGDRIMFRNGREVRSMPRLALGRDRRGQLYVVHCDGRWRSRFCAGGYDTVREAKAHAERRYPGISRHWRRTGYTARQAHRLLWGGRRCTLCRKWWFDVEKMVEFPRRKVTICDG